MKKKKGKKEKRKKRKKRKKENEKKEAEPHVEFGFGLGEPLGVRRIDDENDAPRRN
jgi:hypothetical protein